MKYMNVDSWQIIKKLFKFKFAYVFIVIINCNLIYSLDDSTRSLPENLPKDFIKKLNFIKIPGKNFKMMQYEVTFEQWDVCWHSGMCNVDKYLQEDKGWGRGNKPAIFINYSDALVFAQWLGQITGKHYRLPTEEEWEYAARGDRSHKSLNCREAFYGQMTGPCAYDGLKSGTTSVGSYPPNPYELFDMLGNVWEWTSDCVDAACAKRILKGGSWLNYPEVMNIDFHDGFDGAVRNYINGFRLVEDI